MPHAINVKVSKNMIICKTLTIPWSFVFLNNSRSWPTTVVNPEVVPLPDSNNPITKMIVPKTSIVIAIGDIINIFCSNNYIYWQSTYALNMFDTIFKTNFDFKFVAKDKFAKIKNDYGWQIIQIIKSYDWHKNHLLYATFFTPLNFKNEYENKLNKSKKILIFGDYRKLKAYYHFLKNKKYKVYLFKN